MEATPALRQRQRCCVGDLIALGCGGERSGEEQLCALSHDADICVGSAQSAGAAADTQNNGHLRTTPETFAICAFSFALAVSTSRPSASFAPTEL